MPGSKIILLGYSGHALVVADAATRAGFVPTHYADKHESPVNPFNLLYLGFEHDAGFEWNPDDAFIPAVGNNMIRCKSAGLAASKQCKLPNITDPSAVISAYAQMGKGVFTGKNASVNAMASVGDYCILNTGCIVEHDCIIHTGAHIAPGAVLAGNVTVGAYSFVGANAVIKQGVTIGQNATIGAGAVVLHDVEDNSVYVGNPARRIK